MENSNARIHLTTLLYCGGIPDFGAIETSSETNLADTSLLTAY